MNLQSTERTHHYGCKEGNVMLTDDLVSDRHQLLDSAKELRDRFNAASDRWPSLRHLLVVVAGGLPNEVRGRRCMMQGDTDDGPTFDVTGQDFGSCLGAILQRKPANVSVSSLPIRIQHGGTDVLRRAARRPRRLRWLRPSDDPQARVR